MESTGVPLFPASLRAVRSRLRRGYLPTCSTPRRISLRRSLKLCAGTCRTGIVAFTPGRIAAEEKLGKHSPDLTIRDTDGVVRILVENKFVLGGAD